MPSPDKLPLTERAYCWLVAAVGLVGLIAHSPMFRPMLTGPLEFALLAVQPPMLLGVAYLEGARTRRRDQDGPELPFGSTAYNLALGVGITFIAVAALHDLGLMLGEIPMDALSPEAAALVPMDMQMTIYGSLAFAGVAGHRMLASQAIGPFLDTVTKPLHSLTKGVGIACAWALGAGVSVATYFALQNEDVQRVIGFLAEL